MQKTQEQTSSRSAEKLYKFFICVQKQLTQGMTVGGLKG